MDAKQCLLVSDFDRQRNRKRANNARLDCAKGTGTVKLNVLYTYECIVELHISIFAEKYQKCISKHSTRRRKNYLHIGMSKLTPNNVLNLDVERLNPLTTIFGIY